MYSCKKLAFHLQRRKCAYAGVLLSIISCSAVFVVFRPRLADLAGQLDRVKSFDTVLQAVSKIIAASGHDTTVDRTSHHDDKTLSVDDTAARALRETMRVLCWIPARESDIKKLSLQAINETWVQRCDGHVFFIETDSSSAWPDVISLGLAQESYNHLTEKTQVAIAYLYQRYLNEYDWFLKADVNSYVIMENLRLLLSRYDPKNPVYLGQLYNGIWGGPGFMGGGAGYALSREALRQMVDQGYRKGLCSTEYYNHAEDKHVGECLYKIGVGRHYSLDVHGRESFHMDGPLQMIAGPLTDAMRRFFYFPQSTGPECCSEATISFHGLTPETIRVLENLVYRISVYGRQQNITYLQKLFVPKQIW